MLVDKLLDIMAKVDHQNKVFSVTEPKTRQQTHRCSVEQKHKMEHVS